MLYASDVLPEPTDSTTNIVDKSAAIYMIEEGKTMFSEGKIKDALQKFREAQVKDPYNWRSDYWISQCHYKLNNFGYALRYAKQALALGDDKVNDEIYFILAQTYHRLSNIDSALINYELANQFMPKIRSSVLLVDHHIEECKFAQVELLKAPNRQKVQVAGDVNSGYDDYGAILANDGKTIYFTSRRSNTTGGGMNPDDQTFFEDVYRATFDPELNEWESITNQLGKINSNGFDALNYLSPDGLSGVITLNTTASDAKETTRGSDLCEIKYSDKDTWNSPKLITNKTINTSFFEGSATLTADGNTMYFVSDRKGEKSSTDIYVAHRNGKSWGNAEALPMTVNTKGRETTPYITPDGRYLFFSSDGHVGLGGLDVYVVENLGNGWGTPVNLGYGINSVNNDTHFTYYPAVNRAFISGFEIVGDKSSIDIYEMDMSGFEYPKQ
ncbi:MAG: hypothetical protein A3D92_09475 [Bacteroidetes bacterium RIFCSPHIGHO2_02_FULL_44_7]|nr:MAG: hypothetical protein A3D92_09475 [Bacteroidetes bacterium RIFCSPHIGHO2_02_FULL_44_7]